MKKKVCYKDLYPERNDIPQCVKRIGLGSDFISQTINLPSRFKPVSTSITPIVAPIVAPVAPVAPVKTNDSPMAPPVRRRFTPVEQSSTTSVGVAPAKVIPTESKDYTSSIIAGTIGSVGAVGALGATQFIGAQAPLAPAVEGVELMAVAPEAGVAEIVAIDEATPLIEVGAEAVAAGVAEAGVAGVIGAVGAVAMGAVASVGALAYFANDGLFNFNKNEYQKGSYNTAQEVATRTPPKLRYVEPPPMFASLAQTVNYENQQDQAQSDYQNELTAFNRSNQQSPQSNP